MNLFKFMLILIILKGFVRKVEEEKEEEGEQMCPFLLNNNENFYCKFLVTFGMLVSTWLNYDSIKLSGDMK